MNLTKTLYAIAAIVISSLGFAFQAQATITPFFSAGATCGGAASTGFSPGGAAVTVSLCVSTTTERGCGHSLQIQSANAGENGAFSVASRTLGANYPDPNAAPVFPVSITNPANTADFGGTIALGGSSIAAGANQLLATFTLQPSAGATNSSYVVSLSPASIFSSEVGGDTTCGAVNLPADNAIAASFTLNLNSTPSITSANNTTFTVNSAGTFNVTATGAPVPTLALTGTLPTGVTFTPASGVLAGTPALGTVGSYPVTITASNGNLPNATQNFTLTVARANQTISFTGPANQNFSSTPIALSATATSSLTVVFTSATPAVCSVTGSNVTMLTAGVCTINANQAGNANFNAAPQVQQSFTISATAPGAPTGVTGSPGNTTGTVSFTAPANNGGSAITGYAVTCNPAGGTDTQAGTTSLSHLITGLTNGTGYTCTVIASNAVGAGPASTASNLFTPSLAPVPPAFTSAASTAGYTVGVAGPTFNITATGVPTPTITQTGGILPTGVIFTSGGANAGTATLTGTPTQAGTFNLTFNAASSTAPAANQAFTLTVAKGTRTINFTGPASQAFSSTPIALTATTTPTGGVVTFSTTTPAVCSVTGANVTMITVGSCSITANAATDANYNAATPVVQSFNITQATQTITFGAQAARNFSASPQSFSPLATASSGLPVTYTSITPAVCTVSGNTFSSVAVGTCTVNANQAGNANFSAAAQVQLSFAINQGGQSINFTALPDVPLGTPPFTIAATASSALAVTFTSQTPTVCTTAGVNGSTVTILILGACTIQATQAGNANFTAATPVTNTFQVVPPGAVNLTSSKNPAAYRSPIVLTAAINGTNPTGTVTFTTTTASGVVTLCNAVPVVASVATCPVSGLVNTTNVVTYSASYSGDSNNPSNVASIQQIISMDSITLSATANPAQPFAGAPVVIRAVLAGRNFSNKVSFNENGVALSGCGSVTIVPLPGTTDLGTATCTVPAIAAGSHNYVVTYPRATDSGFEQVIVTVTPLAAGPTDYTDMWWVGASENGWGVSITQHGMTQFIVLYVYDNSGKPIWYSMPGGTWNAAGNAYTGALYQPTSAPFSAYDASQFRPGGSTNAAVGTATVTYTGANSATLTYTINGISGTKAIIRQGFATDDGQAKLQVNDLWWAGLSENGWGLNIAQQGRVLFPIWYTYDSAGRDTWYAMPGGIWSGAVYTGDLYTTISSGWLGINYNPSQFVVTKVGTMSLDFSDASNAIMTYTVNGLTQKKVIGRQPF